MSRRPTGENATVALFPFLAVLMSTMGSLILLLVIISRQARTQVEEEQRKALAVKAAAQAAEAAEQEGLAQQREDLEWDNGQLAASRDKTAAELASQRAQLAHIEEHSGRLRKQLADAQAALKLLESQTALDESARAARKVDLEELRRKIAEKEAELRKAEKAGMRPQAYAIVPFEGTGTRRRPIYIECRSDRIILQPEGIVFREDDFADGQGPANPVAACIRAAAEYSVRMNPSRTGEQPYPLLLVRPDGIPAYYAARAAMSTWDEEFGYELIDADWPLEFPPADPQLAEILARTAEDGRARQALLAKAAPSIRNAPAAAMYGVSRSGHGIERLDDGGGGLGFGSGAGRGGAGSTTGRGTRGTPGGYAGNNPGSGPGGGTFVGGSPALGGQSLGSPAAPTAGGPNFGGPGLGAPGGTYGSAATGGTGGKNSTASRGTGTGTGSGRGDGSDESAGSLGRFARGDGTARQAGQQPGTGSGGRNGSDRNTGSGNGGSPSSNSASSGSGGDGSPFGGSQNGGGGSTASSSAAGAAGGSDSGQIDSTLAQANAAPNMSMVSRTESKPDSLAGARGADWGLPQKGPNATGLSRPIQVYCSNDRIIVFTDRGGDKPIVVEGRTESAVDELVDDVWNQVKSWGSAGRNMYWKPQLTMHVAPDGARRFEELRALLDGSGLDVVGKPIVLATPQATDRQPRR
jgi:hypothetical protein